MLGFTSGCLQVAGEDRHAVGKRESRLYDFGGSSVASQVEAYAADPAVGAGTEVTAAHDKVHVGVVDVCAARVGHDEHGDLGGVCGQRHVAAQVVEASAQVALGKTDEAIVAAEGAIP